ncbi:hypothetical protein NFI96_004725 [Prochilodus magdalenae]|nr:hypothetical protein NFI96_004725 [Prochilodus magdalenae]
MQAFPSSEYANDLKDLDLSIDSPPVQRSLGLNWNLSNDMFTFRVATTEKAVHTQRELTRNTVDWDEPLPPEGEKEWMTWRESLQALEHFETPRCYTSTSISNAQRLELHVFSDASVKAIAAVAYLKVVDDNSAIHVGFIMGKTKLAPMAVQTVPRLELGAAVLAVEIAELVSGELDVKLDDMRFYTDSKVVLGYIHNVARRFYVYVSNRVERIRKFSTPEQWHYVPTSQNPADVATRSVPAALLSNTNWLTGPKFLLLPTEDISVKTSYELVDPELDIDVRSHLTKYNNTSLGCQRFERFSTWQSLVRGIATLIHIIETTKAKNTKQDSICRGWHQCLKAHSPDNLSKAKQVVIRCAQVEAYRIEVACLKQGKEIPNNSPLRKLDPVLDGDGLLRIGGRLDHSSLSEEEKHPLIISGHSYVGSLLIDYYHKRVKHQGRVFTEGAIRSDGIWIVGAKRCIARHLFKCVLCKKLRGRTAEQKMSDLPSERLSTEPPFTNVGIDVFGPWSISTLRTRGGVANSKRWAVIFTCLSVRAVHIELIEAMDTSSFINALRRFLAIRGPVKLIRSDCGTNFKGACRELDVLLKDDKHRNISRFLSKEGCTWIFNPPHSSHMGGVWERMIGVSRRILDSMLSQVQPSRLTHEVLSTLMAEVSAIINARPLTTISMDANAPSLLTPTMILTQKICSPTPPPGCFIGADLHRQQWRRVQHLANTFWERWRREYLSTLQSRSKWQKSQPNVKEGDVVLLRDIQVERNQWPMALVTKTFPGSDNKVRKLELKVTRGGTSKTFLRPITEVVVLLSPKDHSDNDKTTNMETNDQQGDKTNGQGDKTTNMETNDQQGDKTNGQGDKTTGMETKHRQGNKTPSKNKGYNMEYKTTRANMRLLGRGGARNKGQLVSWCSNNHLLLNTEKTVEMVVDFRRNPPPLPPLHINNTAVSMVESLKFLGTTISRDLKWEKNTISIIKKAQQRMFFLRQLKKFNLPQTLMIQFYTAIIESILTASITIWFGSSTSQERTKLQRIIRTAERIIGCNLPSLQQIYTSRVRKRAGKITSDPSHPGHLLFQTLPSGRRLRSIKTSTTRHANSFFPRAVALLHRSGHLPLYQHWPLFEQCLSS